MDKNLSNELFYSFRWQNAASTSIFENDWFFEKWWKMTSLMTASIISCLIFWTITANFFFIIIWKCSSNFLKIFLRTTKFPNMTQKKFQMVISSLSWLKKNTRGGKKYPPEEGNAKVKRFFLTWTLNKNDGNVLNTLNDRKRPTVSELYNMRSINGICTQQAHNEKQNW